MKLINKPKKINITKKNYEVVALQWSQIEDAIKLFKNKVKRLSNFDTILVLVRGAMVPVAMLAHALNKRNFAFYQGMKTGSNKPHDYRSFSVKLLPKIKKGEKILIVEDIIFEGDTIYNAIKYVKSQRGIVVGVCCLVVDNNFLIKHNKKDTTPLICAYQCKHLKWIRFPWERKIKNEVVAK